jgi:hypothetical protein
MYYVQSVPSESEKSFIYFCLFCSFLFYIINTEKERQERIRAEKVERERHGRRVWEEGASYCKRLPGFVCSSF